MTKQSRITKLLILSCAITFVLALFASLLPFVAFADDEVVIAGNSFYRTNATTASGCGATKTEVINMLVVQKISSVAVTEVVKPVAGQPVDFSYQIPTGAGYSLTYIDVLPNNICCWALMDKYPDCYWSGLPGKYTINDEALLWSRDVDNSAFSHFEVDKFYSFILYIKNDTGYEFDENTVVTINGEPAYIAINNSSYSVVYATYNTFEPRSITVSGGTCQKQTAIVGESVTATANAPQVGKVFERWVASGLQLTPEQQTSASLSFSMPNQAVELTAQYADHAPHSGAEWQTDETKHFKTCSVCGGTFDQAEHSFIWVTDIPAGLGVAGKKHEECSVCGLVRNENTAIDALIYTAEIINDTAKVTLAGNLTAGVDIQAVLQDLSGKTVEIAVADKGCVTFDKASASQLANRGGVLVVKEGNKSNFEGAELVLEVYLSGGDIVFENNAKVTVTYVFNQAVPSGKVAKLYYVNGEQKVDMNANFSGGKVTFQTDHFSTYVVEFESQQAVTPSQPTEPAESSQPNQPAQPNQPSMQNGAVLTTVIIVGVVAVVAVGAFAIYHFIFKKKKTIY